MEEVDRYHEGIFKKEVWISGKQGEWYMIGMYDEVCERKAWALQGG